ncbi:hypothetical protein CON17_14780 [Bacillus thuringiensis]|nr:hypothetical protein CON17_14780 [Bacillus thuringiensis]
MFLYLYSEKKPPLSSLLPFTLHVRNNPVNTFRLFLLFYIVLALREKAKDCPFLYEKLLLMQERIPDSGGRGGFVSLFVLNLVVLCSYKMFGVCENFLLSYLVDKSIFLVETLIY